MADIDDQTQEAMGWAAEGKKLAVDIPEVSFKDAATFVAEMTPIVGDVMAAKEVYDELQKDEPNYYLAGALGGAALIGLIPGVGDVAAKAIKKGAREVFDVAKRVEVDPNAMGSGLGNVKLKPKEPKTTIKAYKLFRTDPKQPSKLFPLFVDAKTPVETGTWVNAKAGDLGGKGKVKSKIGPLAYRPGWHAGDLPIATHIGGKVDPKTGKRVVDRKFQPNVREENQVWAEVEMADDVDWQSVANSRAVMTKAGKPNPRTAHITDQLPSGGNYRYKTNSNMTGEWIIGGEMKVNRVLSRDEVNAINEAAGVKDLPTLKELNKSYSKGGVVMDDYQYAELNKGSEDQTRQAFGYALGGLAEDVDPVSGNEVPVGSMPEEVRDDIPAQLSEGEYVVPADVVRFFGVKFFEDIRAEAKQGFSQMESNGRVGGEPIGMEMGGDELPFDVSELQMIDDDEPEQPMMNRGGYISGYAPGGLVDTGDLPLTSENYNVQGMEQRQYVNAEGNTITIMFFNGMPMSVIPAGYTDVAEVKEQKAPKEATKDNNNDDPDMPAPKAINYKTLTVSELREQVKNQQSATPNGLAAILSLVAPPVGIAMKFAISNQSKQLQKELERRLETGDIDGSDKTEYASMLAAVKENKGSLINKIKGLFTDEEADLEGKVADPSAVTSSVEDAISYSPDATDSPRLSDSLVDPITPYVGPEPIEVSSLNDVPGARDYVNPIYTAEPLDPRFVNVPTPRGVSDSPRLSDSTTSPTGGMSNKDTDRTSFFSSYGSADKNSQEVIDKAKKGLASDEEIDKIKEEADRIKDVLASGAKGGGTGFKEGGLVSRPKKKKKK